MAVIAYASANSDPIGNPDENISIDLSAVALPQTAQCYGEAFDSANPANTNWAWTWTILDDDSPGNSAALSSAAVQDPTLDVPTWRNVRLFLVVENTNTNEFSQQDPLLAPDSAFLVAEVLSAEAGLQLVAAGERNYHHKIHAVISQVETGAAGLGAHTIDSHTDTMATGAQLSKLTDGSNATGLHAHGVDDVAAATTTGRGAVYLEEVGGGTAKVITRERVAFQAFIGGSRTASAGWVGGKILPASYESTQTVVGGTPLAIWQADEEVKILGWAVQLVNGGSSSPTLEYEFRLGMATPTNVATSTWTALDVTIGDKPGADNKPLVIEATFGSEFTLGAGEYLGVFCLQAPRASVDSDLAGGDMIVQVFARREVA